MPVFNQALVGVEMFHHTEKPQAARLHVQAIVQKYVVDLARVLAFIPCPIKVSVPTEQYLKFKF